MNCVCACVYSYFVIQFAWGLGVGKDVTGNEIQFLICRCVHKSGSWGGGGGLGHS